MLYLLLFILLYKLHSKYKKKIQQLYKNKHIKKLQIEKLSTELRRAHIMNNIPALYQQPKFRSA